MTTNAKLSQFTDSQTQPPEDQPEVDAEADFKHKLYELGIKKEAVFNLTETYDSPAEIATESEDNLLEVFGIGEKTATTLSNAFTIDHGESYDLAETEGDDIEISEWELLADDRVTIKIGERLLQSLLSDEYGHHNEVADALLDWCRSHREDDSDRLSEVLPDHVRSLFELGPSEINFGRLLSEDDTWDDREQAIDDIEQAHQWARGVIAFCEDNGFEDDVEHAEEAVRSEAQEVLKEREKEAAKRQRAHDLLRDPESEINGWKLCRFSHDEDIVAYRGVYYEQATVAVAFVGEEHARVRRFHYPEWASINHIDDLTPELLNDTRSEPTGNYPETMQEATEDLIELLEDHQTTEHLEPEDNEFAFFEVDGWILDQVSNGQEAVFDPLRYEHPDKDTAIRKEGSTLTLETDDSHDEDETECEASDKQDALELLWEHIKANRVEVGNLKTKADRTKQFH